VFELIRGRAAVPQAALQEILGITQKLTSGYHRDLQLIKAPLFRAIDGAEGTLAILAAALGGVRFRADRITLDPSIHTAAEANALVASRGIPFREAYRLIAEKFRK
jgi:argininosuccinate lyase